MMFKLEYKHTHCRGFWCYFYFFKSFTSANSEFGRFGIWVLAFSANSSSVFFFFPFLSSGKILSYGVITMLVSLSSHQTSCLPI